MRAGVGRLCRRFPGLDEADAAQYLAEARATLGEQATDEEILTWATNRAKADGYDEPSAVAQDQDDDEGHQIAWEARLSDEGAGAHAILAYVGAAETRQSRKGLRVSRRRLRQAIQDAIASGAPETQAVAWGRFGRLLYGLPPATFRTLAQQVRVALGTTWNLEHRVRRQIQASLQRPPPAPEQLSWLPVPPADPPTPAAPEPAAPTEDPRQLSLDLESVHHASKKRGAIP
jgi:hypothetical protein